MQLKVSDQIGSKVSSGELSGEEASRFSSFVDTCNSEFMTHTVITDNKFCKWFSSGAADREIVSHFIIQFSVFSNLFLLAQLHKVINAGSLEGMRASKEILANELGVMFHKPGAKATVVTDKDHEGDPDIVSIEGSVDGGTFRFRAAHFEWLLKMGKVMGIGFNDMGKRRNGTPSTLFFCDELSSIYGNEDPNIAEGASFAVENWAAAGFWKQLVAGLEAFKQVEEPNLPLAFFTWHDRIEDQHAGHVMDELEELYFTDDFDEEKFLAGGRQMLDGVQAFWSGLNEHRIAVAHQAG
jgi:hypothetical protein